jgi:hypothetical protein
VNWYNASHTTMGWTPPKSLVMARKGGQIQGHVQFEMECDHMRYENKVETTKAIHSLNLLGVETILKVFKNHSKTTICQ